MMDLLMYSRMISLQYYRDFISVVFLWNLAVTTGGKTFILPMRKITGTIVFKTDRENTLKNSSFNDNNSTNY